MEKQASLLLQAWMHSHEEDSGNEVVFRPATFPFPRSRGRTGYDFHPDGTVRATGPGRDDRAVSSVGRWEILAPDTLVVSVPGEERQELKIHSVVADKLVLEKLS
jgi:hypothetical protein